MSFQRSLPRLALSTRAFFVWRLPQRLPSGLTWSRGISVQQARRTFSTASDVYTETVPPFPESVSEGTVLEVPKGVGDFVKEDEVLITLETDKATLEIKAQKSGKLTELLVKKGDILKGGTPVAKIDIKAEGASQAKKEEPKKEEPKKEEPKKEEPKKAETKKEEPKKEEAKQKEPPKTASVQPGSRGERRVPASRIRLKTAERLKASQNTAALLTTFNEVDMSILMELRNKYKDEFEKTHKIKLGFMSAFVKASTFALQKFPDVNAYLDYEGKQIVYRDFVDVSVAVAAPNGLVVPVLRNTENMSFAQIEAAIAALGQKARKGQIQIEDMQGGTFTISNGGVFGSLMGTPIINPPQSAILGMHAINKRPVAINDQVVIRPMMYLALTYDHRIIDGSTAVTFLKTIKNIVEDPARLLFEV